jgi:DNA replication protein DnaC
VRGDDVTSRTALAKSLKTLKLSGMLDTLDARLGQAAAGDLGFADFLHTLCLDEINRRDTARTTRLTRQAKFAYQATLEGFDMNADPGIPAARIRDLAALEWLRAGQHVLIYGPVGSGKTHIATALANLAIRKGATARSTTASRMFADLAGGHADGSWSVRLRAYTRPAVLLIDDFAMREMTGPQTDDLYEIVNERANAATGRPVVITSNRAPTDWYALFPNAVVAESTLDRLINNAHHLQIQAASYRTRQRPQPGAPAPPETRDH